MRLLPKLVSRFSEGTAACHMCPSSWRAYASPRPHCQPSASPGNPSRKPNQRPLSSKNEPSGAHLKVSKTTHSSSTASTISSTRSQQKMVSLNRPQTPSCFRGSLSSMSHEIQGSSVLVRRTRACCVLQGPTVGSQSRNRTNPPSTYSFSRNNEMSL